MHGLGNLELRRDHSPPSPSRGGENRPKANSDQRQGDRRNRQLLWHRGEIVAKRQREGHAASSRNGHGTRGKGKPLETVVHKAVDQTRLGGRDRAKGVRMGDQVDGTEAVYRFAALQSQDQLLAKVGYLDAGRAQIAALQEEGHTTIGKPQHHIGRKADALYMVVISM